MRSPLLALSALVMCLSAQAQTPPRKPLSLVAPTGTGRIIITPSDDIQWKQVFLYDEGTRPVLQADSKTSGLTVSWILFPNKTGSTAPNICRDDVLNAAMRGAAPDPSMADIKNVKKSEHPPLNGQPLAIGSYFIAKILDMKIAQQNLFGVASSPTVCANIHISKTSYTTADDNAMSALLNTFTFDPNYTPTSADYMTLGSIYYQIAQSYVAAAIYYQRALDTAPPDSPQNYKRFLADQLSLSYGISGQIKKSRAVNEAAIRSDPDYPLYYYNLACADAEQGKAADAKVHLQQAFERRANTLKGETLPDPTKDDSILKLKKDKEFWAFVESLSKD